MEEPISIQGLSERYRVYAKAGIRVCLKFNKTLRSALMKVGLGLSKMILRELFTVYLAVTMTYPILVKPEELWQSDQLNMNDTGIMEKHVDQE